MGVFDYVDYTAPCPKCGTVLDKNDWQTKDGQPYMNTVRPETVWSWHAICPNCREWVEAHWEKATDKPPVIVHCPLGGNPIGGRALKEIAGE